MFGAIDWHDRFYTQIRFGSLADILTRPHHDRFTSNNGRWRRTSSQHLAVGFE
jgi:hypothetical protein